MVTPSSSVRTACACASRCTSAGVSATRRHNAAIRWAFSIFQANACSPSSAASNRTSGARQSRPVSSTMRMTRSGAASSRQAGHTPRASSAATEGDIRAVVRLSIRSGRRATSTVGTPPCANASAAMRPAGPPPTTAAWVDRVCGARYERAGFGLGGHVVNPLRGCPHHGPVMMAVSIRAARWVARAACGA